MTGAIGMASWEYQAGKGTGVLNEFEPPDLLHAMQADSSDGIALGPVTAGQGTVTSGNVARGLAKSEVVVTWFVTGSSGVLTKGGPAMAVPIDDDTMILEIGDWASTPPLD